MANSSNRDYSRHEQLDVRRTPTRGHRAAAVRTLICMQPYPTEGHFGVEVNSWGVSLIAPLLPYLVSCEA